MFDIELSSEEGGEGTSCSAIILRRDYQEFRALHLSLTNLMSTLKKKDAPPLPILPSYRSEKATDAHVAEELTAYIIQLLAIPDVTSSRQFLSLLNDHDGAGGAESSGLMPENAVDFLLQPCPYTSLYVARRNKHEEEVEVPAGSTILWRFMVGDGLDIQFTASFASDEPLGTPVANDTPRIEEMLMEGRFPSTIAGAAAISSLQQTGVGGGGVTQGSYTATTNGTCTLRWDNSYSRLRGKQVQYIVQVVAEEAMQAAMEAAEEMSKASSRNRSLITSKIEVGDGVSGKISVKITPVIRPAMDADSFFNKDDLTINDQSWNSSLMDRYSQISGSSSLGETATSAVLDTSGGSSSHEAGGRRTSLGAIWGYLYSHRASQQGGGKGEEDGEGASGGGGGGQQQASADLEKVVSMIEKLEDELARTTAKKEQAEAETVIALAKQRRWSIEKEKFERRMNEALVKVEQLLEQVKILQTEKIGLMADVATKEQEVQEAQEAAKRSDRECDVLKAEKHVWTIAHSGVREELTNLSGTLEKEKQAHEDTRVALKKAKEAAHKTKSDMEVLKARLEAKVDERSLQTTQEELSTARAEIRDLTEAIEETAAENDTLRGQVKLLAKHVKQQKQDVAVFQAEIGQLRMRVSSQDKKVVQLKAEKKLLIKELKAGRSSAAAVAGLGGRSGSFSSLPTWASNSHQSEMDDSSVGSSTNLESSQGAGGGEARKSRSSSIASTSPPPPPLIVPEAVTPHVPSSPSASSSSHSHTVTSSPATHPPPPQAPPSQKKNGKERQDRSSNGEQQQPQQEEEMMRRLEQDPRYIKLMNQLESCTERRQQLLALYEEDPQNDHVKQLLNDLENVLSFLRKKMRTLMK